MQVPCKSEKATSINSLRSFATFGLKKEKKGKTN
jgi:hypothetical protein